MISFAVPFDFLVSALSPKERRATSRRTFLLERGRASLAAVAIYIDSKAFLVSEVSFEAPVSRGRLAATEMSRQAYVRENG